MPPPPPPEEEEDYLVSLPVPPAILLSPSLSAGSGAIERGRERISPRMLSPWLALSPSLPIPTTYLLLCWRNCALLYGAMLEHDPLLAVSSSGPDLVPRGKYELIWRQRRPPLAEAATGRHWPRTALRCPRDLHVSPLSLLPSFIAAKVLGGRRFLLAAESARVPILAEVLCPGAARAKGR